MKAGTASEAAMALTIVFALIFGPVRSESEVGPDQENVFTHTLSLSFCLFLSFTLSLSLSLSLSFYPFFLSPTLAGL